MKITKRQLINIIREERQHIKELARGMPPMQNRAPSRDSNWHGFADVLDLGTLDLDEIAYALGFRDFYEMDASITPRRLRDRDPLAFNLAVEDVAGVMDEAEIETAVNAPYVGR